MLRSYVVEGGLHGHGMEELAKLHLDYSCISFKDICGKGRNQITFDRVPLDKALDYTAEQADVTLRLHEQIGRAHVLTPVTNAHLVCRLLLEKKNHKQTNTHGKHKRLPK